MQHITLEPGFRLDRYELLCPIAQGGMAQVWLARLHGKRGFEKLVAVKTILSQYATDLRFQQMFLDEARIVSGIEHPNVAQIFDLGEHGDILFLVMEWVDGESLSKLFRASEKDAKHLPPGIVARIMVDACAGLHAAHELTDKAGTLLNVVHRDVSPQNILVSVKGAVKVIDFGIAKARDRVAGDTSTGMFKGKILYMAPEQALGRVLDRRADVWAVGAMMYHLLAGIPAFEGENQLATLHLLTHAEAGLVPLPERVPLPLRTVIDQVLVKDPDKRIATAAELGSAIEDAMRASGLTTTSRDVAAFVISHLTERNAARKKAVDLALEAAAERQRIRGVLQPPDSGDSLGGGRGEHTVERASTNSPSFPDGLISTDGLEPASTATLGSAAVVASAQPPARKTRVAIAFGIIGVCTLVGALALGMAIAQPRVDAPPSPASSVPSDAPAKFLPPNPALRPAVVPDHVEDSPPVISSSAPSMTAAPPALPLPTGVVVHPPVPRPSASAKPPTTGAGLNGTF